MFARTALLFSALSASACAELADRHAFIDKMAQKHQFSAQTLETLFAQAKVKDDVLTKIAKPAEALPWYKYRKLFMTEARIKAGVEFWRQHAETLSKVSDQYGVPPEIIVAILGVETLYGRHTGNDRVIDALSTLAFHYPPRSPFFSDELEQFLLLCREEGLDPLQPTGSYAGAMGMPQFMPGSYRKFAADFEGDGKRDIWHNPNDAIASIANYFKAHGWTKNTPVAVPVTAENESYKSLLEGNINDYLRIDALESAGVKFSLALPENSHAKLLAFEQEDGDELWAILDNFYVITRYNHSTLYALAVFQLSQALLNYQIVPPYE